MEDMKILKRGNNGEWWVGKIGACKTCHTEVQIEQGDKVGRTFDRDGDLASVECPNCKAAIWVYPASKSADVRIETWKGRARQHGCNVEEGDHECG
jgi:hypothetical protein